MPLQMVGPDEGFVTARMGAYVRTLSVISVCVRERGRECVYEYVCVRVV